MPTAAPTAPARRGGPQQKQAPPQPRVFRVGVQSHEQIDYDDTRNLTASTQDLPVLNLPPEGYLRGLYLLVEATGAGNTANVTAAEDGPWSVIDTVTLEDVNSAPIVGPFGGFDLYVLNKYGGYAHNDDPRAGDAFTAIVTGTGDSGGSFAFCLRIPVELVNRDALGALPNKSGTSMFKLRLRLAPLTIPFGTDPNGTVSVRTRVQQVGWWDPPKTDLKGRPLAPHPPAVQTTQYWSKSVYTINAGSFRQQLERVGYGIRNLIFILEDSNSSRSQGDADFPDPGTLQFEANIVFDRIRRLWRDRIARDFGYTGTIELINGRDYGVYPLPFNLDFGLKPGAETRRGYLWTSSSSRLEIRGTITGSGAHTLSVLTNDVAPARDEAELVV